MIIRLNLMGNDRDTDKTVGYDPDVSINQEFILERKQLWGGCPVVKPLEKTIEQTESLMKGTWNMNTKIVAVSAFASMMALAACVEDSGPTANTPAVGSSSDLSAFEGARAGQAEMGIQNLGYELIRTEGLTAYWFNRTTGACARITTSDGRYSDVTMLPAQDC